MKSPTGLGLTHSPGTKKKAEEEDEEHKTLPLCETPTQNNFVGRSGSGSDCGFDSDASCGLEYVPGASSR